MRTAVRLDGTVLLGEGTAGGLRLTLPGLLLSSPPSTPVASPPDGTAVLEASLPAAPMERSLRWRQGSQVLDLRFPVATPEVTGGETPPVEMGPRVLGVRTPLSPLTRARLSDEPWDLVVWSNARAQFTESEGFVRNAVDLRQAAGPAPMLWAPRVATPGRLAPLFSFGIDLLDTTEGLWAAAEGRLLAADTEGLEEEPEEKRPPRPAAERGAAAAQEYLEELLRVRRFARAGRLRELVEARLVPEPRRGELLRYFDGEPGRAFQEAHAPVVGRGVRPYTTKEALRRPEAERFRRRFLSRYSPPSSKRVLLLVPCSKTKPYARSPTHRKIARALEGIPGRLEVHWASVTSPLGIVPRELESTFPACHYDIPVTGAWDEDERAWVRKALQHLLATHAYPSVIVHLPAGEYSWLGDVLPPERHVWSVEGDSTTSSSSLARLAQALRQARASTPRSEAEGRGPMAKVREEFHAVARFQFGGAIADRLFDGEGRLMGRPWFQRLVSPEREDLATWKEETGLWRLTLPGARRVVREAEAYAVEVRGGVELRGDLFAPGVSGAGPEVRVGDDVVLVRGGEVLGVGEARVPGPWMGRLPRGLVVKVRHRAHGKGSAAERGEGSASVADASSSVD